MNNDEFFTLLMELDTARQLLAERKAEEDELAECVIAELRRRRIDSYPYVDGRQVVLDRPLKTTVSVADFRAACQARRIGSAEREAAIKETVSVTVARRLLGADALPAISVSKPGSYRVRFLAARNTD